MTHCLKFLCLFFLVASFGCSPKENKGKKVLGHHFAGKIPTDDKIMLSIINKTGKKLEKRYKMIPCGFGINNGFKFLEISFHIRRPIPKEELRCMLIDCADEFLKNINTNEEIKPYLENYPFTHKNVGIIFYIYDTSGDDLWHPNITIAEIIKNKLSFKTEDPEDIGGYKEETEETIEEALQLINTQKTLKET